MTVRVVPSRLVLAGALGLAAVGMPACGAGDGGADSPADSPASAAATIPATETATEATGPARRVTSACALLPKDKLVQLLGGNDRTDLTAEELPVRTKDGEKRYTCEYGNGKASSVFAVLVSTRPGQAGGAADAIEAIADASGAKTTPVDGPNPGVGYVADGVRVAALAVPYQEELRLVIFTSPKVVPHERAVQVAEHVAGQLGG